MTSITLDHNLDDVSPRETFRETIGRLCLSAQDQFVTHCKRVRRVHIIFALLGLIELSLLVSFFSTFMRSSLVAICLAVLFLTAFSYAVVRIYLQTSKPDKIYSIYDRYLNLCKESLSYQEGIAEHHLAAANSALKLVTCLHDLEYSLIRCPRWLSHLQPRLEKLSCYLHFDALFWLREHLLLFAIDEHLKVVKCEPTQIEAHAALANAYVMLSSLYGDPRIQDGFDEDKWIPPQRYTDEMQDLFKETAKRAIEEFKILSSFAPDDPWVHSQLAYSYHDLHMPMEEISEYEILLRLTPDDTEVMFKLGVCYFKSGLNSKGLQVYSDLRKVAHKRSEDLIQFYGSL